MLSCISFIQYKFDENSQSMEQGFPRLLPDDFPGDEPKVDAAFRGIWYEDTRFIASGDTLGHFRSKWFRESKLLQTIRSYVFLSQIIENFDFLIYAD